MIAWKQMKMLYGKDDIYPRPWTVFGEDHLELDAWVNQVADLKQGFHIYCSYTWPNNLIFARLYF